MIMSIRTSKNNKGRTLSGRSPVRTLLESMLAAASEWVSRRNDKSGKKIGKVTQVGGDIIKWGKDSFSLYGRCREKTICISDIRGDAVFLRRLPDGKIDIADIFLFCLGGTEYMLSDWPTVWKVIDQLNHDHGTVIYKDAWRLNRIRFVNLLQKEISRKSNNS